MTELFLNLAWLLLVLPAFWLWRQDSAARMARRVTPVQCMLALGCVLVLLFPVISASDDLHAMRAEMEESATSKRTIRQASADKSSGTNRLQAPPAAMLTVDSFCLAQPESRRLAMPSVPRTFFSQSRELRTGRAPPYSLLG